MTPRTHFRRRARGFALRLGASLIAFLALVGLALAMDFPPLTGRIVDQANVIPQSTRAALDAKLAQLEAKSGIQLVVATVTSLDGQEIEPYANALFRAWKLGEAKKNNGVLLLVAPNEHRVRIEVGYGLEGTLTDALSKIIITNAMTPRFKAGDYGGGVTRGVDDVITVLTTDSAEWQKRPDLRVVRDDTEADRLGPWIVLWLFSLVAFRLLHPTPSARRGGGRGDGGGWVYVGGSSGGGGGRGDGGGWVYVGGSSGGGGGGWGDGGGFSGGGGSSGGGGASGGW